MSLIENIQRENLTPIEEANMYLTRLQLTPEYIEYVKKKNIRDPKYFPRHQSEIYKPIAKKYSKGKWTIWSRLCLLSLPENPIQNAIHLGDLELQVAEEISRLRQIKDVKTAQGYMLEIYNDYLANIDTMSILSQMIREKKLFNQILYSTYRSPKNLFIYIG